MYNYEVEIEELFKKAEQARDKKESLSFKDILKEFKKEDRPRAIKELLEKDLLKVFKK